MILFMTIVLLLSLVVALGGGEYKYSGAILYSVTLLGMIILLIHGY